MCTPCESLLQGSCLAGTLLPWAPSSRDLLEGAVTPLTGAFGFPLERDSVSWHWHQAQGVWAGTQLQHTGTETENAQCHWKFYLYMHVLYTNTSVPKGSICVNTLITLENKVVWFCCDSKLRAIKREIFHSAVKEKCAWYEPNED